MKIAVYGIRIDKEHVEDITLFFRLLEKFSIDYIIHNGLKESVNTHCLVVKEKVDYFDTHADLSSEISYLISIGGDGTFLDTILLVKDLNIPILGINTGRLGFLSSTPTSEIELAIHCLINKDFTVEHRSLLRFDSNQKHFGDNNHALNEISILKSNSSSMITIHVDLNGTHLNSYWTDGLIISTATGSTAYSLSCGGPIMMPGSGNFVITPIAPHNLNVRPIVVDDDAVVTLSVESRSEKNLVALDSRSAEIENGEVIKVQKANYKISILQLNNQSFVNSLRNKLNWGLDKRNR